MCLEKGKKFWKNQGIPSEKKNVGTLITCCPLYQRGQNPSKISSLPTKKKLAKEKKFSFVVAARVQEPAGETGQWAGVVRLPTSHGNRVLHLRHVREHRQPRLRHGGREVHTVCGDGTRVPQ